MSETMSHSMNTGRNLLLAGRSRELGLVGIHEGEMWLVVSLWPLHQLPLVETRGSESVKNSWKAGKKEE